MADDSGLPEHVVDLARNQADHLEQVIQEANNAEARREKATRVCPPQHLARLERKFERERHDEVSV